MKDNPYILSHPCSRQHVTLSAFLSNALQYCLSTWTNSMWFATLLCISHHHKNLEEVKSEPCPLSTSTRSFHTSTQLSSTADCVTGQWCRSMNAECERWDNSVSSQILGKTRVSQEALLKSRWGLFQTSARALLDAVKSLSPPTQLLSTWWCLVTFSESPFIHQLSVACEGTLLFESVDILLPEKMGPLVRANQVGHRTIMSCWTPANCLLVQDAQWVESAANHGDGKVGFEP